MKVNLINKNKKSLTFVLDEVDVSIANALRRMMIAEVPTLAIEDVYFHENTSSLFDEIIAHRLGMVPIKTDPKLFNYRDDCKCKDGCPSCTLKLSVEKEGPCTVYSHDLKSEDKKLKPIENIPIVKLGKKQRLVLEADALLGNGKRHAKWQPGIVSYKNYPKITITKECDLCGECVKECPKKILKLLKKNLKVVDETICTLCNSCAEACEQKAITVEGIEGKFVFKIEANGSLTPQEIFTGACNIFKQKAESFEAAL